MYASGDHAGDVDVPAGVRGVVVKAECRRTDAFHAGAGVDDENDRQIEFFGDQRGTGDVAVVQPHHPLDDADLPLTAAVVPSEVLGTLEPVIERARGAAGDPLVVARIDEVRAGLRGLDDVSLTVERAANRERRDRFAHPRAGPADEEPVHARASDTSRGGRPAPVVPVGRPIPLAGSVRRSGRSRERVRRAMFRYRYATWTTDRPRFVGVATARTRGKKEAERTRTRVGGPHDVAGDNWSCRR